MTAKKRIIDQAVKEAKDRGKLVFMGNSTGVVEVPGEQGKVYVTDQNGHVLKVWNARVQNIPGHAAWIKVVDKRLQITELWDMYQNYVYPKLGPHHLSHEWAPSGSDIVRVWGDVFMPWRVIPISAFTIRIYKTPYLTTTGWNDATTEDKSLSGLIPAEGYEKYVLLSVSTAGVVAATDGDPVILGTITMANIPATPSGNKNICAIHLYYGQTTLSYNPSVSDFKDLRHMQAVGGGGGGGEKGDTGVGVKGDTGIGIQGDTGIPGSATSKGDTGVGVKGDTGIGVKGDTGIPGSAVDKGDTGVGAKGDTGVGIKGDTGAGAKGDTGVGAKGDTGAGLKGDTGATGSGGGIEEAPEDSKVYGREDADWAELPQRFTQSLTSQIDGETDTFILGWLATVDQITVFYNGIRQEVEEYSLNYDELTFSFVPDVSDVLLVEFYCISIASGEYETPSYDNAGGKGSRTSIITMATSVSFHDDMHSLIDGSYSANGYFNNQAATGLYLSFDFGHLAAITEATWYQDAPGSHGTWKWQGSLNNIDWVDIGGTFNFGVVATQIQDSLYGNTIAYRYYRILGISGNLTNGPNICEYDFKIGNPLA